MTLSTTKIACFCFVQCEAGECPLVARLGSADCWPGGSAHRGRPAVRTKPVAWLILTHTGLSDPLAFAPASVPRGLLACRRAMPQPRGHKQGSARPPG